LFLPNISSVPTQVAAVFMQEVDAPANYSRNLAASTLIIFSLEMLKLSPKKIQRETVTKKKVEDKTTNLTTYNGPKQNWIFWYPTAINLS